MILLEEELESHLGNDLDSLEGKVGVTTLKKLREYDTYTVKEFYLPALDYLFLAHQHGNKSLKTLSKEVGIDINTLARIFRCLSFPRLTSEEANRRNVELGIGMHGQSKEEKQRYGHLGGVRSVELRVGIHDPKRGKGYQRIGGRKGGRKSAELGLGMYSIDPEAGESYRNIGLKKIAKLGLGVSRFSKEERQRYARMGGVISGRKTLELGVGIHNPEMWNAYLPTYHGFRSDIGFDAKSAWEVNLARVLMYCEREFYIGRRFKLRVPENYMD